MKTRIIKVKPYSPAEARLMELFGAVNMMNHVVCRLGEIFGWPYNEYEFDDETYYAIRNYLKNQ